MIEFHKGDTVLIGMGHEKKKICGHCIITKYSIIYGSTLPVGFRKVVLNKKILLIEKDIVSKADNKHPSHVFVNAFGESSYSQVNN